MVRLFTPSSIMTTRRVLLFAISLLLSPSPLFSLLRGNSVHNTNTFSFLADAQSTGNINGIHTVYAGDQYADCTGFFCFSGPNWGSNGKCDIIGSRSMGEARAREKQQLVLFILSPDSYFLFFYLLTVEITFWFNNITLPFTPSLTSIQNAKTHTTRHDMMRATPGQFSWQVKVTFSQSAATYSGGSCFANTVEYYDWNKLWGKGRCGYTHNHQLDSDRFVWRRLQNLHTSAPNCGGNVANCSGIQLGTYSYDNGVTPYPNENWALSKTFSTILQPDVAYILRMDSYSNGTVVHSIISSLDETLLESKTNVHSNLCVNYEQGAVLGLYFGGTCAAPQDITVKYETVSGPTNAPSVSPTRLPSSTIITASPTKQVSSKPTLKPTTTKSPTRKPTRRPTRKPK